MNNPTNVKKITQRRLLCHISALQNRCIQKPAKKIFFESNHLILSLLIVDSNFLFTVIYDITIFHFDVNTITKLKKLKVFFNQFYSFVIVLLALIEWECYKYGF